MPDKMNLTVGTGVICLMAIMGLAITQQEFSWWVFPFAALFGTIFAGVLSICISIYRDDAYRKLAMKEYPDQPWMWDRKWRMDTLPSQTRSEFRGNLAFSIILSIFAFIGVFTMLEGLREGNLWTLLGLIPLPFAAYAIRKCHQAWRTLRFERGVALTPGSLPGWVGSGFSAQMDFPNGSQPESSEVWLEYTRTKKVEESDGVSFSKVTDREIQGQIDLGVDGAEHNVASIRIDIPKDAPETSWTEETPNGWWEVVVSARVEGKTHVSRYRVPIADPERYQLAGA